MFQEEEFIGENAEGEREVALFQEVKKGSSVYSFSLFQLSKTRTSRDEVER